ncbi:MAG: hypothetical protein ABIG11_07255 [bacterium]
MRRIFMALALTFLPPAGLFASTDIYIGVASAGKDGGRSLMGMPLFFPERPGSAQDAVLAANIRDTVRSDLMFSRYFEVTETGPAVQPGKPGKDALEAWKALGAQHLLTGKAADLGKAWTISAKVHDLNRGEALVEKYYKGQASGSRRAAHMLADEIVWRLTGKPGIAHTRVAFANDSSGKKEIYTVDYDGQGLTRVTRDSSIALLPRWSPDGMRIYYTTYRHGNPDMFEIDFRLGKIKPFTTFQGLNIAGGVSPDGRSMVMTLSRGKDPNIHLLNMETGEIKKITSHFGVDTSATYSPDGRQIAFVSDRSGNPQVHVMDMESGSTRRLTRLNWCDSPSWSPSGEWIVFAGRENPRDRLDIYLVDITGNQIRRITRDAGSNEDPSWSPDGRFIAFTSTRGGKKRQLYVMDADGSAPHLIADMPGNCYTPSWSP